MSGQGGQWPARLHVAELAFVFRCPIPPNLVPRAHLSLVSTCVVKIHLRFIFRVIFFLFSLLLSLCGFCVWIFFFFFSGVFKREFVLNKKITTFLLFPGLLTLDRDIHSLLASVHIFLYPGGDSPAPPLFFSMCFADCSKIQVERW